MGGTVLTAMVAILATLLALPAKSALDLTFYGTLGVSMASVSGSNAPAEPANSLGRSHPELWDATRSRVGLKADYDFGLGWRARGQFEQTLRVRSGDDAHAGISFPPGSPFDAIALVQFSHYSYGKLQVGRRSNIASDLALDSQAWGGETLAGDPASALLSNKAIQRTATVTYESPVAYHLTAGLQVLQPFDGKYIAATLSCDCWGKSLLIGWTRNSSGDRVVPIGLIWPFGPWRALASATFGETDGHKGRYGSVALTRAWKAGEWRIGFTQYRVVDDTRVRKASIGFHQALTPQWVGYVDAVKVQLGQGAERKGMDVGLKYSF